MKFCEKFYFLNRTINVKWNKYFIDILSKSNTAGILLRVRVIELLSVPRKSGKYEIFFFVKVSIQKTGNFSIEKICWLDAIQIFCKHFFFHFLVGRISKHTPTKGSFSKKVFKVMKRVISKVTKRVIARSNLIVVRIYLRK